MCVYVCMCVCMYVCSDLTTCESVVLYALYGMLYNHVAKVDVNATLPFWFALW